MQAADIIGPLVLTLTAPMLPVLSWFCRSLIICEGMPFLASDFKTMCDIDSGSGVVVLQDWVCLICCAFACAGGLAGAESGIGNPVNLGCRDAGAPATRSPASPP